MTPEAQRYREPPKPQEAATAPTVAEQRFFEALDRQRTNWREYNNKQAFLNWLNEIEPLDGLKRQDILDGHVAAYDVNGLIGMLDQFDAVQAPSSSASPTAHPTQQGGSQALAAQQASDTDGGLVEWWKQSEIREVMQKKQLLSKQGRLHMNNPQGKAVLEAELSIQTAIANGRVLVNQ